LLEFTSYAYTDKTIEHNNIIHFIFYLKWCNCKPFKDNYEVIIALKKNYFIILL